MKTAKQIHQRLEALAVTLRGLADRAEDLGEELEDLAVARDLVNRPEHRGRQPTWDTKVGYAMWRGGATYQEIAKECHVPIGTVSGYASKHDWVKRRLGRPAKKRAFTRRVDPLVSWDVTLGRQLWGTSTSVDDIGKAVGATGKAVRNYAERHGWPPRPRAERGPKWDTVKAKAMYDAKEPLQQIADACGVSTRAITKYAEKEGWSKRGRGWHPDPPKGVTKRRVAQQARQAERARLDAENAKLRAEVKARRDAERASSTKTDPRTPSAPRQVTLATLKVDESLPQRIVQQAAAPRRPVGRRRIVEVRCPECQKLTRWDPCWHCNVKMPTGLVKEER